MSNSQVRSADDDDDKGDASDLSPFADMQRQRAPVSRQQQQQTSSARSGGSYFGAFQWRMGSMIDRFSDRSIEAAEAIGAQLEKMSESMTETCTRMDEVRLNDTALEDGVIVMFEPHRRFLDHVQQHAPELYERMGEFSVVLNNVVAEAQIKTATGNFFDPIAHFGEKDGAPYPYSTADRRWLALRRRNYRMYTSGNGGGDPMYRFVTRAWQASTDPSKLDRFLQSEIRDAETGRRYAER